MRRNINNIRNIQYSQEVLARREKDFQNVTGGQKFVFRYLLILFAGVLLFISGCFTGLLGGILSTSFFVNQPNTIWIFFTVTLSLIIWLIETIRISFAQGISKSTLTIVILSCLLLFKFYADAIEIIYIILFFTILAIADAALSLISGAVSSSLIIILFDQSNKNVKKLYFLQTVFFIFVSFSVAYLYGIAVQPKFSLPIIIVSSVGGLISGVVFIAACLLVSHFADRRFQHFQFLRSWAIALSCWGSTSFDNLDLSEVNFRGAKLANTDLRARKLYRTCFQEVTGLDRARVDSRYLDLEIPKVQKLLTQPQSEFEDKDFSELNLRGAYLQNSNMQEFNFTDTDLTGADMQGADLRKSILVRAQVMGVDFTGATLTGICIEDWSVNSQTKFTNVKCDYVFRQLNEKGKIDERSRFPLNRIFEPREFESLYQEVENVVELIFQEGENWQAALYSLIKLQAEDEQMNLQLKGVEKRGDVWVVKVTYNEAYPKQEVEQSLNATVEEMKRQLTANAQQIYQLEQEKYKILEIAGNQSEALKGLSKTYPLGNSNNFFLSGSTITNLSGSGQIEYGEASAQVRSIVASSADSTRSVAILQSFLAKLQSQSLATDTETQAELIGQMILTEAQNDVILKQYLIQQEQQIVSTLPERALTIAIKSAIAQLRKNELT